MLRLVTLVCLFAGLQFFTNDAAAAYPATCAPSAGATQECTARIALPWRYSAITCKSSPYYRSESEALQKALSLDWQSVCNVTTSRIGWLSPPGENVSFCGGSAIRPNFNFGFEQDNASKYSFQWTDCSTGASSQANKFPVYRNRGILCPPGYDGLSGSNLCGRTSTTLDPTSNLGKQCPTCGNPISLGIGNKFQEESDYRGSGTYPLAFFRYYNSGMRIGDTENGLYGVGTYASTTSQSSVAYLALNSDEGRYKLIGLDLMGANWRHTYQRSIYLEQTENLSSAQVYRPDGQVLIFNDFNGQFTPPANVADRLEHLSDGTWRYTIAATEEVETYSADGRLETLRARSGETLTLSYDSCQRLATVSDMFGRALTFTYAAPCGAASGETHITSVTDPSGNAYSYSYDAKGNLASVTYPDGSARTYHYESATFARALTGITDEANNRFSTWSYDSDGRANSSTHAGGADSVSVRFSKGCDSCDWWTVSSATVTDSFGTQRRYVFSGRHGINQVSSISQPAASGTGTVATSYTYDANGNIASKTDFNGFRTCYKYDSARNLETVRLEGLTSTVACPNNLDTYTPTANTRQRKISTTWDTSFRLPTQIVEFNRTTTFTHDSVGNVLTRTLTDSATGQSRTWTYTYNPIGQVLTVDGPRTDLSDITTYTYYSCSAGYQCGQVHTITDAAGHVTIFDTYNAHGQPLTISDANGAQSTLTYDLRQHLTSRTISGETTSFEYWPTGLLKKVTQPNSSFVLYTYDDAHRLYKVEDGLGNRIQYTLDAMGNHTAENVYDPSGLLTRTRGQVFNSLNQLWKQLGAGGTAAVTTTFGYDNNGNQTTTNAPLSRNSINAYDELNRLKQITDPGNGVTQFGYDANDNLTAVTDPRNLVTSYVYNGFGDLKTQTSPDTGVTSNTYDTTGNLQTSTDARGVVTTYTYDELNRVKSAAFKLGTTTDQTISFTYDERANGKGHLTGASDVDHALAWNYDALGRLIGKGQTVGSLTKSIGYGYSNGRLSTITLPSGQLVTYEYNSNNQVTGVRVGSTTVLSNALYDPFGPITGWTWGNGTLMSRTYDKDGKLAQFDSAGLKTYAYDDAFRITGITDADEAANSWTYGYDSLDRITSASKAAATLGWTYDANGNRLTQSGSGASTYAISNSSNRISSITGTLSRTYNYDSAGNTTAYTEATATYNNRGRMKTLTKLSVTATYVYNALGQLIKQSGGPSGTVLYMYDESGHLVGEYTSSGGLIQETAWLGDIPVATLRPNGASVLIYYVHTDHLNTPLRVTRPTDNKLMWSSYASPFGTEAANENPAGVGTFKYNLRFAGQLYDSHAGLHQNWFRDYDPSVGRYTESDPIGMNGGANTYGYVSANPVMSIDPRGLAGTIPRVGPPGIVVPDVAIPGTPANDAWVNGASDAIDSGLGALANEMSGVSRPKDLSTLETRAFDRYCRNYDPCPPLKAATMQAITMARLKMNNLLNDPMKMFGTDKWFNHQDDLRGRLSNIFAMISLGQKLGCDMTAETIATTTLMIPSGPK